MKNIALTAEARHAIRCKGPTNRQLVELLNGHDAIEHLSRQIRWMAYEVLVSRGCVNITKKELFGDEVAKR